MFYMIKNTFIFFCEVFLSVNPKDLLLLDVKYLEVFSIIIHMCHNQ